VTESIAVLTPDNATREALLETQSRFLTVNEGRLARLRDSLQARQQQCLDLLPLLFHCHLPGLPGYIDDPSVPSGLINYQPSNAAATLALGFNRTLKASQLRNFNAQLMGLYLMGSSGSIAQSTTSDLDLWLCYNPGMERSEVLMLEEKARAISSWAEDFNLEVHIFLMNAQHFQGSDQRSLTGENCGSTQHFLLLDEFYRTGQWLAGALPAWWLVPSERETEHDALLEHYQAKNLIRREEQINLGPLPSLPPGEFIGAGMWQLYKGIESPHKSVLKLLLLEIYAREFPSVTSLAHQFKSAIYNNFLTLNDLDPYIQLYRRIETYLTERKETDRLSLVRRCFYFKVGIALSRPARLKSWRRQLMQQLVDEWRWSPPEVAHLDSHRNWSVSDVMRERKLLVSELTHSYRFLTQFAAEHQSNHLMSQQDLLIISRKLHAAFDRRRGKIDFIRFGQDIDFSYEKVRIYERPAQREDGEHFWAVYTRDNSPESDLEAPLKSTPGLLEALLWCHLNGLLDAHLHIPIFSQQGQATEFEVRKTLATLRQALPSASMDKPNHIYSQPARIERVLLFINLGYDPLQHLTRRGLQKISERSNSLDFSALRENLVGTLDVVLENSWGEITVERFARSDALNQALQFLITRLAKQTLNHPPEIHAYCHNQTRPQSIAKRVQDLFDDAIATAERAQHGNNLRFLFNLGDQYQGLQLGNKQLKPVSFESESALIDWLGTEQAERCPIVPDRLFETHRNHLQSVLAAQPTDGGLLLVFQVSGRQATIYLLDEQSSLLRFSQPFFNASTLLAPLLRFLKISEHRQRSEEDAIHLDQRRINCFEMTQEGSKQPVLKRQRLQGLMQENRFINIQAFMDRTTEGQYEYQMICNEEEFSTLELGDRFYTAVASYIVGLRAQGLRYPMYITDLALSDRIVASLPFGQAQTLHYVRAKLRLEQRINEAMRLI
jgi:adenylate cyclase class 1